MSITERAALVLQQIDEQLALADKAKIKTIETMLKHISINTGSWLDVDREHIAAFIAASRTGWPTALRCLKTAIEGLIEVLKWKYENSLYAADALTTLCDQWEASRK